MFYSMLTAPQWKSCSIYKHLLNVCLLACSHRRSNFFCLPDGTQYMKQVSFLRQFRFLLYVCLFPILFIHIQKEKREKHGQQQAKETLLCVYVCALESDLIPNVCSCYYYWCWEQLVVSLMSSQTNYLPSQLRHLGIFFLIFLWIHRVVLYLLIFIWYPCHCTTLLPLLTTLEKKCFKKGHSTGVQIYQKNVDKEQGARITYAITQK